MTASLDPASGTTTAVRPCAEVVVIGAGPAGCMAAITAAKAGARVALLERTRFPREKVCGCCIAPRGIAVLTEAGLGHVLHGAARLTGVRLASAGSSVWIERDSGVALSRGALDARLARAAMELGIEVEHGTSATVGVDGVVRAIHDGAERTLRPAACIVADGLAGRSLDGHPSASWGVSRGSRVGLGAILPPGAIDLRRGEVLMHVEAGGYVGAVELEDGRIDVAAAMDHHVLRREGPAHAMSARLGEAVTSRAAIDAARWTGTPWLTRRRTSLAMPGILVAGDAAGYVEPFTGEGMSWALASGHAAGQLAARMVHDARCWTEWPARWADLLKRDRWRCAVMSRALRSPRSVHAAIAMARLWPTLATRIARTIGQPPQACTPSTDAAP
ncbi:MAG: hypothetical protein RLZ94_2679 [Actinomycetota bacterium]